MGDIAVDYFLETLKDLIRNSKLVLIIGAKYQLQSLEMDIMDLRKFLKFTEKKRNEQIEVMKLVTQIKDVVFEAENIVDLFVCRAYDQDHLSCWRKFFYWLSPCELFYQDRFCEVFLRKLFHWDRFCELFHCKLLCNNQDHLSRDLKSVKMEIETLKTKVQQICDENMNDIDGIAVKKLECSFTGSSGGGSNPSNMVGDKVVVGFKEEVETLMGYLHNSGNYGQLEIISIVGIPGGGKTTLAREVYNQPLTLHTFEICAWVVVSQDYDMTMKKDLLICILKSAFPKSPGDYEMSNEDMLGQELFKRLRGKKYLIVMDDIWSIQSWNDIQKSFPRDYKGSKVMFTSRESIHIDNFKCIRHHLNLLPKCYSWELLEKKVFGTKQECPQKLVNIGKEIAEKCKGLPLAIVLIAGVLATRNMTLDAWKEVSEHLTTIIAESKGCMEILELSYNYLPLHLKACFLYIGAHPADYEIPIRDLIWLWIAEGFIQRSDGQKNLEAIAEDCLYSLVNRSLVMVARKSKSHGGIKACHIHDLLHGLCLKIAKEDDFFVKIYEGDSFSTSATNKHRRLFIGHQFFHKFPQRPCARNLRSFLCLSMPNSLISLLEQNMSFFVENLKLLRVLHLISAISLGEIGVGDLVHLRYLALALTASNFYGASNSFHYLPNLEILYVEASSCNGIPLPRNIIKMAKLRHLYAKDGIFEFHRVSYGEDEGNKLESLQTLYRTCICEHCLCFLERTPNLRKLGVGLDFNTGNVLMIPNLEFLKCLERLSIVAWNEHLHGRVASTGLILPPSLKQLTLNRTHLNWKELSKILKTLPNLEVLKLLKHACMGPVWDTSEPELEEGFPHIKYLRLVGLDIKVWKVSENQFSRLEVLVIDECKKLKGIPIELADLYGLREIKVERSSRAAEEWAKKIQKKKREAKGEDDCLNLLTRENE